MVVARSGRDCDRRLVPGRPGGLVQIPRVPECEITCGGVRTASRAVAGTAGGCTERYSPGHRGIPFLQHLRSIVSVRCSLSRVTAERPRAVCRPARRRRFYAALQRPAGTVVQWYTSPGAVSCGPNDTPISGAGGVVHSAHTGGGAANMEIGEQGALRSRRPVGGTFATFDGFVETNRK